MNLKKFVWRTTPNLYEKVRKDAEKQETSINKIINKILKTRYLKWRQ